MYRMLIARRMREVNKKGPSWLVLCLIGLAAGLLLSMTNRLTKDQIVKQEAAEKEAARSSVLETADQIEELEVEESKYNLDNIFEGVDADGNVVGYVGQTTVTGFGGPIEVITGVDKDGVITGISVGGSDFSETAGLGAKTQDATFTDQFKGKVPTIVLNEDGVDSVTGASTSSRAVISGVNSVANYIYTYQLGLMEEEEVYTGSTVSATEQGFGGPVTVNVGLADDGTIEYLAIDTPDETDGLGKMASEKAFTSQFIGKSGPFAYGEDGIEALSGATYTSTAVITALNTIMEGGGTQSAEPVSTTVKGFGGDVTVTVRLNADNSVAALTIDTPDETDGLGKTASDSSFTSQFIGKMAPFAYGQDGIEAITGASVTSGAVLDALNSIVPEGDKSLLPAADESASESAAEGPAEAEGQTEAAPAAPMEGEETASAPGIEGGDVTVHLVKNDDGSVSALTIDTPNETPGLGTKVSEEASFAEQFIGKTGPFAFGEDGIEAIAGATVTSQAALDALNSLYSGAAVETAAEEASEAADETVPEAVTEAAQEAAAPAAEGEETASAPGIEGGDVTVHLVKNEDGSVASLTIDTPNETPGLGTKVSEEASFAEQFIGKTGPFAFGEDGIEAIAGATVTSQAALDALNSLYSGAAVETAAEEASEAADETVPEAVTEAAQEAAAPAAEGEETASAPGIEGGDVTVHLVKNEDGSVASLTIDTPNETPGLGTKVSEEASFAEQFIGKTGPFAFGEDGIEAIAGATVTSQAALDALNSLYSGAAVETAAEEASEAADETVPEAVTEAAQEAAAPAAEGEETASAPGIEGGDVTVHLVKNEDGSVASLTIDTPNETPGLGTKVSEEASFADQFIGKTGPFAFGEDGVEAIAGATVTSQAALDALNSLFEEAAGEVSEAATEEATEAATAAETEEATEAAAVAETEEATEEATEKVSEAVTEEATEAAEEAAEEATEESTEEAEKTASAPGIEGGDVTVHAVMDADGSVKSLTIDTPDETPGLGTKVSEEKSFADQFIGKKGPFEFGKDGIEALTGATVTSQAALDALNSLFEEADEEATEEAAEEPTEESADGAEKTASAPGIEGGDVTVHAVMDADGSVKSLTIDTPDETPGLGTKVSEEKSFADQFIGKKGPFEFGKDGIEALTGATVTSQAALDALNSLYKN